jgi:hypothetical protein
MEPKSRKEIINTCQNNFLNYSTFNQFLIIISVAMSAASVVYYICEFLIPILQGIVLCEIVGWQVLWKIILLFVLYCVLKIANIFFIAIGGFAMCQEENWDNLDFSKAWFNFFEHKKYIDDEISEK